MVCVCAILDKKKLKTDQLQHVLFDWILNWKKNSIKPRLQFEYGLGMGIDLLSGLCKGMFSFLGDVCWSAWGWLTLKWPNNNRTQMKQRWQNNDNYGLKVWDHGCPLYFLLFLFMVEYFMIKSFFKKNPITSWANNFWKLDVSKLIHFSPSIWTRSTCQIYQKIK